MYNTYIPMYIYVLDAFLHTYRAFLYVYGVKGFGLPTVDDDHLVYFG